MKTKLALAVCVLFGMYWMGCDDGEDKKVEDTKVAEDTTGGEDAVAETTTPEEATQGETTEGETTTPEETVTPTKVTFKGTLIGFGTDLPVADASIELFDNDTGNGTGVTSVSGANGEVEFPDMDSTKKLAFKTSKENHKDTYQFNYEPDAADETLWIVSNTVYQMALGLAGLVVDAGKGTVAGAIYFVNDKGEEEPVGCATVSSDPAGDVRYMACEGGLPTTLDKQASTCPAHGRFLATNLPAGKSKVIAKVGETEIGSIEIFTYADAIGISNIYVTGDKNPTPADCK
jgi:hypothetical protein